MSVTLNTSGLAATQYTGAINVAPTGYQAGTITLNLTVNPSSGSGGGGGTGNATNIGAMYPNQYAASITALGENHYYFIPSATQAAIEIDMLSTDWTTHQDIIISPSQQPLCVNFPYVYNGSMMGPVFWYGFIPTSNQTVTINKTVTAGTIVYITVCNRSNITGGFKLYWE